MVSSLLKPIDRTSWLGSEPILTGDLILTEVLQGFRSDRGIPRSPAMSLLTAPPANWQAGQGPYRMEPLWCQNGWSH